VVVVVGGKRSAGGGWRPVSRIGEVSRGTKKQGKEKEGIRKREEK